MRSFLVVFANFAFVGGVYVWLVNHYGWPWGDYRDPLTLASTWVCAFGGSLYVFESARLRQRIFGHGELRTLEQCRSGPMYFFLLMAFACGALTAFGGGMIRNGMFVDMLQGALPFKPGKSDVAWYTWVTDPKHWLALCTAYVAGVFCFIFSRLSEKTFEDADALTVGVFVVFGNQFIFERLNPIGFSGYDMRWLLGWLAAVCTAAGGGLIRNVVVWFIVCTSEKWSSAYLKSTMGPIGKELTLGWLRYSFYAAGVGAAFIVFRFGLELVAADDKADQVWLVLYCGTPLLSLFVAAFLYWLRAREAHRPTLPAS